ncbi:MAG: hypothetical protein KF858_13030 [Candidatus Sumerlaeia bacterium]|nr:hypothetical protein [Candidatus Sumerlaeia bacterium]
MPMTHRERAVAALERRIPDRVPHFELAFYETAPDFEGREFLGATECPPFQSLPYEEALAYNARLHLDIARRFDHSIIPLNNVLWDAYPDFIQGMIDMTRLIREASGDEYLVLCHGDATFGIPTEDMEGFCERLVDDPQGLKREAEETLRRRIGECRRLIAGGLDGFTLCADYAFNSGPFLSPAMFEEFVHPYLKRLVHAQREMGAWVIKHSDGNLMPVMDMIVDAAPHALHSIDPMAGMDIRVVKERWGDRLALCGNVHCAHMQTGTPEQVRASAEYCLRWGKPGGGYIFSTSNCVFKGLPIASYHQVHAIWMRERQYAPGEGGPAYFDNTVS